MNFQNGLPRGVGLALAALGALMLAALSRPLQAHADGLPNPLANFMQPGSDNNGPIDYTPRPALVVPPTNDLPPPQTSSNVPGANWPKAPDTKVLDAAKADSRRPAPSEDSQVSGVAPQTIYVRDEECNKILGMCFNTPGAADPKKVVLNAPQRRYLIDPPASYLAPVAMQPGDARYAAAPEPSCAMPGWFGCPERPQNYWRAPSGLGQPGAYNGGPLPPQQPGANGAGANGAAPQPDATAVADGDAPPGQIFGQQAPAPQKKCPLGPGWFGCQELPQTYSQPQPPGSQAQAQAQSSGTLQSGFEDQQTGPVPPGQVFGQPRAPLQQHCMLNGWFGCQEQ